jgi:hypothetical protein
MTSKPEEDGARLGVNESVRWVESYAHLVGLASELTRTRLVCVGDRESDLMALFEQGQRSAWAVDLLVRAKHNRVLPDRQVRISANVTAHFGAS